MKQPDEISTDEESEEKTPAMRVHHLRHSDMDSITNGLWLNDVVVHVAQQLIKDDKDLLPVDGLQNPREWRFM